MQIRRSILLVVALLGAFVLSSPALEPASHFSDHMVLQRDMAVPVWGTAEPGAKVTVAFAGQTVAGKADTEGRWRVSLKPLRMSKEARAMKVTSGGKTRTIKNVLVGEVWLGSGQSNMAGRLGGYAKNDPTLAELLQQAPYPQMRLMNGGPKPKWVAADADGVNRFSAILFAFGERLHRDLDVPVGLIVGAVGGTPSGAWIPAEVFEGSEKCRTEIAEFAKTYDHERKLKIHAKKLAAWEKAAAKAKAEGKKVRGRAPRVPAKPGESTRGRKTGGLFDTYIRSSIGYAVRGVLWDQGEAGSGIVGLGQHTSMSELIRGWRELWGQGEFPFVFVQKPSGMGNAWSNDDPITCDAGPFSKLPDLRRIGTGEARYLYTRLMLDNPNAWMVPVCDLGKSVHPRNKWGYGNRAAQVALQKVYAKPVQAYGPLYRSHEVRGAKVIVKFDEVAGGLATRHGDGLQGFAVAGKDGRWHWAAAKITGKDTVELNCADVKKPQHVRFAYSVDRHWANLFNKSGLPALAFTTEDVAF